MLFLDSPWPILVVGLIVEAVLAVALFRTGRGKLLWAMAAVAFVVVLGVLIEQNTVTDTKRVRQTLAAAAAGLQANRLPQVHDCISPGPDGAAAREKAAWALGLVEFQEVSIRGLDLQFNYRTSPPTVKADIQTFARGRLRSHEISGEVVRPVRIQCMLRKENGRWLVYGLPEHDARP
jgi:hypothetical protein